MQELPSLDGESKAIESTANRPRTICRVGHRSTPYTQLSNRMLRDKRLSVEARGALAFILSHPADWQFELKWLSRELGIGRDKSYRVIDEHIANGYCVRQQPRAQGGKVSAFEYVFSDVPAAERTGSPLPEKPEADTQDVVSPLPCLPDTANQEAYTKKVRLQKNVVTPLPPKGGPHPLDTLRAFEDFNAMALRAGLQQAAKLTPDRNRKIIARLKDYGDDGWARVIANVEASAFLKGRNDRRWRATLDFLLQPAAFGKVHDGHYDDPPDAPSPRVSDKIAKIRASRRILDAMVFEPQTGAA